jgi:acetyltransferase-like isoleucine patch superfamily enzyme
MMIRAINRILVRIYHRVRHAIELNRYNDFTIEDLFRKQGARVGKNNRIEIRNLGAEPYLITIGNHCTISPGVVFLNHDGATWIFTDKEPSLQQFGTVTILDNCFIGLNAILMGKNITIGPNSIVAAGSVVTKSVPPDTIVGGNPARKLSTVDQYKDKVLRAWKDLKPDGYFEGVELKDNYKPEQIQGFKDRDMHLLKDHLIKHFRRSAL